MQHLRVDIIPNLGLVEGHVVPNIQIRPEKCSDSQPIAMLDILGGLGEGDLDRHRVRPKVPLE